MVNIKKKITLTKIATRDRSLFNGYVWHKNKRLCFKTWLNYTLRNDAVVHPANCKMSIWLDPHELTTIRSLASKRIKQDSSFIQRIIEAVHNHWLKLEPFTSRKKSISTQAEFKYFLNKYIIWWSHASMLMIIPDLPQLPQTIKRNVLDVRAQYEMYSDISDTLLIQYFKKHFPRYASLSTVISPREIDALAKHTLSATTLNAVKRRINEGWALINGVLVSYNDSPKLLSRFHLTLESYNTRVKNNTLTGTPAYPGRVRGIARLVMKKSELEKVRIGDILVSDATSPDFLPAMKKAAAFITDEGGLTCHAAIVAREMKKPCIVGTKIATQVIKNGMPIDVDAKRGIVTIIKE